MEEKNVDHRQPEFEVKPRVLWPDCNFGQAHRGQLTDRLSGRIRPKLGDGFRSIPIHREISGENQAKIRPPVSPKGLAASGLLKSSAEPYSTGDSFTRDLSYRRRPTEAPSFEMPSSEPTTRRKQSGGDQLFSRGEWPTEEQPGKRSLSSGALCPESPSTAGRKMMGQDIGMRDNPIVFPRSNI